MTDLFRDLFDYNHFYNLALVTAFEENAGRTSERSESIFHHLLLAHHIWNSRILEKKSEFQT